MRSFYPDLADFLANFAAIHTICIVSRERPFQSGKEEATMASILPRTVFGLQRVELWSAPCGISWDDRLMVTRARLHPLRSRFVFLHQGSEWVLAPEQSLMVSAYADADIALCSGCDRCNHG
jgi:hypothetical protein